MRQFSGRVWRHVPVGAQPLHLGWILKAARGRWNSRRPRLPCLYTSLTAPGAIAEFAKHVHAYGAGRVSRDLVSVDVEVHGILDLTEPSVLRRWGISQAMLVGDRQRDLAGCRAIAQRAILREGYRAIMAPSASLPGARNLMIFIDTHAAFYRLDDGPDRITIRPGDPHP